MSSQILKEMEHDDSRGALTFKGVRYLIIRPDTIMGMFKALVDTLGWEKAGEIFYGGGFEGGKASTLKFREAFNLSPYEAAEYMCRMGRQIGWGRFELETFDSDAMKLQISVKSSPFAEMWMDAGKPVCHFIRGVVGGLGEALFGVVSPAEETDCIAKGDVCCRFVAQG